MLMATRIEQPQRPESSIAPVPDVIPPEGASAAIAPILDSKENV
jgi:hypothetical protein